MWDQTIVTKAQQKWLVKLVGLSTTRERKNSAAYSLSRHEEDHIGKPKNFSALNMPLPSWTKPIREEVLNQLELQTVRIK